jgi:polyphosphate glucokinase
MRPSSWPLEYLENLIMSVLAIDAGGTHVKILASGKKLHREIPSGPTLTARRMVAAVKKLAGDWKYDVVSIGWPGLVVHGRPVLEPHNLGPSWEMTC